MNLVLFSELKFVDPCVWLVEPVAVTMALPWCKWAVAIKVSISKTLKSVHEVQIDDAFVGRSDEKGTTVIVVVCDAKTMCSMAIVVPV